jgi:hypothetical protein
MGALGAVDQKGAAADRLVALLAQENLTRRLAAADALGAMGPGAGTALGKIIAVLDPIVSHFASHAYDLVRVNLSRQAADDRLVAARLLWVLGRIGKEAIPALAALCETNQGITDARVRFLLIGSLAQAGPEAAAVASRWFEGGDKARQALAIDLMESLVRHHQQPTVLAPFCDARMAGAPTELTVRAAEWLLRAEGTNVKGLDKLIELCQGEAAPDLVRQLAAEALARQAIAPWNGMPDDARRRATKALVGVIARGKASPIVVIQCAGLEPFLEKDDLAKVQQARAKVPAELGRIYIPFFDSRADYTGAKPGD